MKYRKIQGKIEKSVWKFFAVLLLFSMLTGDLLEIGMLVVKAAANGEEAVSMTEIYNNGNYGVDIGERMVTISSKEELIMLQEYTDDGQNTEGITFLQMKDIVISDYSFKYEQDSQRTGIYLDGELQGAVNVNGHVYADYTSQKTTTLKLLGIQTEEQKSWNAIGFVEGRKTTKEKPFRGTYLGNYYKIKGLWNVGREVDMGLFAGVYNGKICNLVLEEFLLVGISSLGGIAGKADNSVFKNCTVNGVIMGADFCGGFVGDAAITSSKGGLQMKNCTMKGVVVGGADVGGLIGVGSGCVVSFCKSEGKVIGRRSTIGGIGGILSGGKVRSCTNFATVQSAEGEVGGIIGNNHSKVLSCVNYGEISGVMAGGITGCNGESGYAINCENKAVSMEMPYEKCGGITGENKGTIRNCLNSADIIMVESTGGIAGYNTGSIQNSLSVGGVYYGTEADLDLIRGVIASYSNGLIENCYYPTGKFSCVQNNYGSINACYPVTGSQIRGTEQSLLISEETGSYAYTSSVVLALNNFVLDNNKEIDQENSMYLKNWIISEEGLPAICDNGAEAYLPENTDAPITEVVISTPSSIQQPDIVSSTVSEDKTEIQKQKVSDIKAKVKSLKKVRLTWQAISEDSMYQIYRSRKKNSGYQLAQTIIGKTFWIDKKVKKGKKYYYKIRVVISSENGGIQGEFSDIKKVKIPWYTAPKVRYTKERLDDGTRCLSVCLKKYQGTDIEILIRKKGEAFKAFSLNSSKIKAYRGIFRLTYTKKGQRLFLKVRTYQKVKGKKKYSMYTPVKKVRL